MSPQIYYILQTDILWLTFPLFIITASTPSPSPPLIAQSWEWATLCFAEPQRVHVPLTWFPSWSFAIFLSHYKLKEGWASLTLLIFRSWELMVGAEAAESPRRMWTVFLWFFFFITEEGVTRWPLSWRRRRRLKVCVWFVFADQWG